MAPNPCFASKSLKDPTSKQSLANRVNLKDRWPYTPVNVVVSGQSTVLENWRFGYLSFLEFSVLFCCWPVPETLPFATIITITSATNAVPNITALITHIGNRFAVADPPSVDLSINLHQPLPSTFLIANRFRITTSTILSTPTSNTLTSFTSSSSTLYKPVSIFLIKH